MPKRILIVGAGGHGRAVAEAVSLLGEFEIVGLLDDSRPDSEQVFGAPILGGIARLPELVDAADFAVVAIGNNAVRERLQLRLRDLGFELATIVHPRAFVSRSARIGRGCVVMAAAVVGAEAQLGDGVILNTAAIVDHHCVVDGFAHLGVNACMAGGSALGRSAWMQAGAALGYGVQVPSGDILNVGEVRQRTTTG